MPLIDLFGGGGGGGGGGGDYSCISLSLYKHIVLLLRVLGTVTAL